MAPVRARLSSSAYVVGNGYSGHLQGSHAHGSGGLVFLGAYPDGHTNMPHGLSEVQAH